jgi:hypothetical protein
LWALPSRGAEAVVTAGESQVRTAPFAVAPVLARVHAGDRLPADDQAHDGWRRVRLPDGRYGYLGEPDVHVSGIAPPPAPAAMPEAAPARQEVTARVDVLELGVRSAPAADAPVLRVLSQNTRVVVLADVKDGWRHVELSDGQRGFVAEAGLKVGESAAPSSNRPASPNGPTLVGVIFELLPIGRLREAVSDESSSASASADTMSTVAVAPFMDFPLSPYFTIGLSPQIIFHVKADGADGTASATELDLRGRLTGRVPISPNARVSARISPALSFISLPSSQDPSTGLSISTPQGFLVDFSLGAEVQLIPNLFLVLDLGYQLGFQSAVVSGGPTPIGEDFQSRYLHLGGGFAIGF